MLNKAMSLPVDIPLKFETTMAHEDAQSEPEINMIADDNLYPIQSQKERKEQLNFMRAVKIANENDEKADVRDGIKASKGKLHKCFEFNSRKLQFIHREQNTKVYKMLNAEREISKQKR